MPWLGLLAVPIVLAAHVAMSPNRKAEAMIILAAGLTGFFIDTFLMMTGVFTLAPYIVPFPFSPPWMVMLWMDFATALNVSLKKLHGRYLLSAVLGAVGGPSAYYSGAKLGATISIPGQADLIVISAMWAAAVPALFWIAGRVNTRWGVVAEPL